MDKDKKKVNALIHRLGLKYKLSDNLIREIVESPYKLMSETMGEFDIRELESEEDIDNIQSNFNLLAFCKIYIDKKLVRRKIKQLKGIKNYNDGRSKKSNDG